MRRELTIRRDGLDVVVLDNGRTVFRLPYQAALEMAAALRYQAQQAEEQAQAERIALDSAVMLRAGVPFILSNRPDILAEAKREAAWGRDLRRYMPDRGIRSQEKFGVPMIKRGDQK